MATKSKREYLAVRLCPKGIHLFTCFQVVGKRNSRDSTTLSTKNSRDTAIEAFKKALQNTPNRTTSGLVRDGVVFVAKMVNEKVSVWTSGCTTFQIPPPPQASFAEIRNISSLNLYHTLY